MEDPKAKKLNIDLTGRQGLGPRWYGDINDTPSQHPEYRYISAPGQLAAGLYNPRKRYGYLAPSNNSFGQVLAPNGDTFNQVTRSVQVVTPSPAYSGASKLLTYFFGENGPQIFYSDTATNAAGLVTKRLTNISGTAVIVTDLNVYQVNGARALFYTYQSASGGNMGMTLLDSSYSANDTFLTTTTSGGSAGLYQLADHSMISADNGYMYVLDGNYVHKFDGTGLTGGTNGTFTPQAVVFPSTVTLPEAIDWGGFLWIALNNGGVNQSTTTGFTSAQCGIYVWDRITTVVSSVNFLPIAGVIEITKIYTTSTGRIRIMCRTSSLQTEIREYNGVTFDTILQLGPQAYTNWRDCMTNDSLLTYWQGADNNLYLHGKIDSTEVNESLYVQGSTTPLLSAFAGAIFLYEYVSALNIFRTGLFVSCSDTNNYYNFIWEPNGGTTIQPFEGDVYSTVSFFPTLSKVNYVRIWHFPGTATTPTQVAGTLNIYLNQSTTAAVSVNITQTDLARGYKYVPVNQGAKNAVYAIQAGIKWNTSFATTEVNTWMPRNLEVDFNPLEKLL